MVLVPVCILTTQLMEVTDLEMIFIALGCVAFLFFTLFDLHKLYFVHRIFHGTFFLGIFLVIAATAGILMTAEAAFHLSPILRGMCGVMMVAGFTWQFYALFWALPFQATYLHGELQSLVITSGAFALCRHPGVLGFGVFYFFLWLASGVHFILVAGMIWTIMDIIHVSIQDNWLFPRSFPGYGAYQKQTPFLMPTTASLKLCIDTFREGRWDESGQKA
ncbi:hypothetical protein AAIG11_05890 [Anoxynatronum sibiricum]|uniref:Uncharacterized protein n=2 Tax=Anoxynatronum sibiricum TaxID=210623 RepID=A0ABU9VS80_9CLOT